MPEKASFFNASCPLRVQIPPSLILSKKINPIGIIFILWRRRRSINYRVYELAVKAHSMELKTYLKKHLFLTPHALLGFKSLLLYFKQKK
ncbi:MAG: hypothetical protein ACOWWR_15550 [Eubacteriales bacterium]